MGDLNKVMLIGNLTKDPEAKTLPSGQALSSFSIATNRTWKDKDGNKQEGTEYHNIVVFGKQAETCNQYLKKGQSVLVEGRMQTRSWDDKNSGEKKYRTEIVADRTQFGPKGGQGGASSGGGTSSAGSKMPATESQEVDAIEYPEEDINPEDIPF